MCEALVFTRYMAGIAECLVLGLFRVSHWTHKCVSIRLSIIEEFIYITNLIQNANLIHTLHSHCVFQLILIIMAHS